MQLTTVIAAFFFAQQIFAQKANITASTCVSPDGFTSCYNPAASTFNECAAKAGSDTTQWMACSCELLKQELGCALSNCWNVVYGCEYQSVASMVTNYCLGDNIPFFPAPDNAPGGCSCNLGYVIKNITAVTLKYNTCVAKAGVDLNCLGQCNCCEQSGVYTSQYSICPNTDPLLSGFQQDTEIFKILKPQFDQCGSDFAQANCVRDLGFPKIGSISYLSASPASTGTKTLSNLAGTITAPLLGQTFTWSVGSGSIVITAAHATGSASSSPSKNGSERLCITERMLSMVVASLLVVLL